MVLVSGFNVYPNEVEAVLSSHPQVLEAAVIGVESDRSGEAVRAYIVSRGEAAAPAELDRHCRLSLAAYKVPREFVFMDSLPKSSVGKILRAQLRSDSKPDLLQSSGSTIEPRYGATNLAPAVSD